MNAYKAAWLQNTEYGPRLKVNTKLKSRKPSVKQSINWVQVAERQTAEQLIVGSAYAMSKAAAQSQMMGKAGMALRVGGRVGLRVIPVVNAVLLAHDIYRVGKWAYGELKD